MLLSKLIVFAKHGCDMLSDEKTSVAVQRKLDATLPSKFGAEDRARLQAVILNGNHRSILTSHLLACLNDALIINLGKRANMSKCKLITYGTCPPQSALG